MQLTSDSSSPGTSCKLGPGSENTWKFEKYTDNQRSKCDELAKQVMDEYLFHNLQS